MEKPIKNESDVLYVFVQSRKSLDHLKTEKIFPYGLIRFYANWVVHIDIYDTKEIEYFLTSAENSDDKLLEFITLGHLAGEFREYLNYFGLSTNIVDNTESWITFLCNLRNILVDVPLFVACECVYMKLCADVV